MLDKVIFWCIIETNIKKVLVYAVDFKFICKSGQKADFKGC